MLVLRESELSSFPLMPLLISFIPAGINQILIVVHMSACTGLWVMATDKDGVFNLSYGRVGIVLTAHLAQ